MQLSQYRTEHTPGNEDRDNLELQFRSLLSQLQEEVSDEGNVTQTVRGPTSIQLVSLKWNVFIECTHILYSPSKMTTQLTNHANCALAGET